MPKTIHEYRTVKLKDGLVITIEKFLDTRQAKQLGLETIADVVAYYTTKGMESFLVKK